jgi:hypothetical protein
MAGKFTTIFLVVVAVLSTIEASPVPEPEPQVAAGVGVGVAVVTGVVRANSCSENFCYHNNHARRDKNAAACGNSRRWSYDHPSNGRCYCYEPCN